MDVKVGKSYTRKYYEDLVERFETEAKYLNTKEELEKKRDKILTEIKEAYSQNMINSEHLQKYIIRLEKVRLENEKKQFSMEELKIIAGASKMDNSESGVSDKQDKNIDMANEKSLAEKNKMFKER